MSRRHKQRSQVPPAPTPAPKPSRALLYGVLGIAVVLLLLTVLVLSSRPRTSPSSTTSTTGDVPGPALGNDIPEPEMVDGVQVIRTSIEGYEYVPATLTAKAGVPVRFIVDATDAQGCAQAFMMRDFGIGGQRLVRGENTFEFTPTEPGTYEFSCTMRMVVGNLIVT